MISVKLSEKSYWDNKVEGYLFLLEENFKVVSDLAKIEEECYPHLKEILKKHKFEGKLGQSFVLTGKRGGELVQFIFGGLGKLDKPWDVNLENLRRAAGNLVGRLKEMEISESVLEVPAASLFGIEKRAEIVKQITVAVHMAGYEFSTFKSPKKKEYEGKLFLVIEGFTQDGEEKPLLEEFLYQGQIIGRAVNVARRWDDTPPNVLTPTTFAEKIQKMAKEYKLGCTVFGRDKAIKLGMGGFAAVDAGSEQEGKFVVVEYKAQTKDALTVALVGKGLTFDSGGISLKPASAMIGMKFDMCGAAAVFGAIKAIAELGPNVNVIGIAAIVENMPSGKCFRQDDIITFMNGKTAEIINTDAEGRLILADALCYAEKFYKPDVIIDIATLTGAAVIALGHFFTALMTRNEKLYKNIKDAAKISGDRVWRLPFDDDFKPALESDFADLANCGKRTYGAGTITAGMFLENFVAKTTWAHLDIGGTGHDVPGIKGASGVGVRLFVEYVMGYRYK